jgi:3-oxoadipate enol-lactonase
MKLAEKRIKIEDGEISYFDEGQGEKTIIFIHGFPFNKSMWENQLLFLRDRFRVIAYDVRGHGNTSDNSKEFSISQFAFDLFAFLDQLKIEKVIVCGLSMGGYIALHAIDLYPERIEAWILSDTQCAADTDEARDKRIRTIDFIQRTGLEQYAKESVKSLFAPASLENNKMKVEFIRNTILNTKAENICKTLMALANRNAKCSILHTIKVPTLILVGAEDKVTPLTAASKMHELIQGSLKYVIPQAGHLSNLENPDEFNDQLRQFLNKLE